MLEFHIHGLSGAAPYQLCWPQRTPNVLDEHSCGGSHQQRESETALCSELVTMTTLRGRNTACGSLGLYVSGRIPAGTYVSNLGWMRFAVSLGDVGAVNTALLLSNESLLCTALSAHSISMTKYK